MIDLRHRFEFQAEVQIQRQSVGRGGHPGLGHPRTGNGRGGGHSGGETGGFAPDACRRDWPGGEFGIAGVSVFGPASPDASVAPDATRIAMECKEKRRVVGSVGSVPI